MNARNSNLLTSAPDRSRQVAAVISTPRSVWSLKKVPRNYVHIRCTDIIILNVKQMCIFRLSDIDRVAGSSGQLNIQSGRSRGNVGSKMGYDVVMMLSSNTQFQ